VLGYLDHAASTPMRPEAVEAMMPFLSERFANPSGAHKLARESRRAIDDARDVIASALGPDAGEIVFTSGGTESDNLAVLGVHDRRGGVVVCSAIEHHAVLDAVQSRHGRLVGVDRHGVVDLDALADAVDRETTLVSVMLVNNEVGTVQPLADVERVVREHAPNAVLHTDAVQALTWLDVASHAAGADLVSISAHKFGGPKGVGALVVRKGVELAARQLGGGQERGLRSGTHNVAGIVAMARAAELASATRADTCARVATLRERLARELLAAMPRAIDTVAPTAESSTDVVPGILHLCIDGIETEALLYLLEKRGVYASAASSCSSGAMEPSHVLAAMGVPRSLSQGSLRLSLGWSSTDEDVDLAREAIPAAVERLREFTSPTGAPA
jgi:cysteine desulfurase